MGRVTLKKIMIDMRRTAYPEFVDAAEIEVVPRKIVEKIIEQCNKDIKYYHLDAPVHNAICNEAQVIKRYAEKLLREFEEDE